MALPIGIGDFITVCTAAYKVSEDAFKIVRGASTNKIIVLDRCRASVTEFRELSKEVASLELILGEIQSFWTKQKARNHDLPEETKIGLSKISSGCREVLDELNALLNKHRELGKGQSWRQRLKWAPKDIGPMRHKLMLQTINLNTFHAASVLLTTADAQEKSQAQILLAVNTIHKDYEDGRRRKPALSQATVEDIDHDESEAWEGITREIERQNVDRAVIVANRNLIKRWIHRVMLEDVGESEEYDPESGPSANPPPRQPATQEVETDDMYGGPERTASWVSSQSRTQVEYDPVRAGHAELDEDLSIERAPSFSSHRSKSSDWRPVAGPNPRYVEGLLVKLLESAETVDKSQEHVTLVAKRMFRQLDFADRGHLFHASVEQKCWIALEKTNVKISKKELSLLIKAGNQNNKIDLQEFITFVKELITLARDVKERAFKDDIQASNEQGVAYISEFLEESPDVVLPWNWTTAGDIWEFRTPQRVLFQSKSRPRASFNAFVNMELAASRCIDVLDVTFEEWFDELKNQGEEVIDEYQVPFRNVLEVAAQFSVFKHRTSKGTSDLDDFDELFALIPTDGDDIYRDCPILALRLLKDECSALIRSLLGFVMALDSFPGAAHQKTPLGLEDWRKMRIKDRADRIFLSSSVLQRAKSTSDQSRGWIYDHPEISKAAFDGLEAAYTLHQDQVDLEEVREVAPDMKARRLENGASIHLVGGQGFPRNFAFLPPRAYATVYIHTKGRSIDGTSNDVKGCDPEWNYTSPPHMSLEDRIVINVGHWYSLWDSMDAGMKWATTEFRISEEITDLTVSRKHVFQRSLRSLNTGKPAQGKVKIAITPSLVPQQKPQSPRRRTSNFANVQQLLKDISEHPLPDG
ncbi:serine palmitoyltransferase component [Exophiala xenobiotica]|nr:serine palmitoyltransferase component [Exophiala xenobiotica]KAK5333574.1 serine palmitoyltransferase component [Exophiala xenobiotica]